MKLMDIADSIDYSFIYTKCFQLVLRYFRYDDSLICKVHFGIALTYC